MNEKPNRHWVESNGLWFVVALVFFFFWWQFGTHTDGPVPLDSYNQRI